MVSKSLFSGRQTLLFSLIFFSKVLLRSLRCQILSWASSVNKSTEEPKTAIYRNRGVVLLYGLLHYLPLSAALTLIVMNAGGYFVGGVSTTELTALQFVAKVLEVLTQASLASTVLFFIRQEIAGEHSLPLGSLLAPSHTADVSYLWSLEFWGSVTSKCLSGWRRILILIFIVATIVLAALVGPSGAILLIPRPIHYATDVQLLLLDDAAALYPEILHLSGGQLAYVTPTSSKSLTHFTRNEDSLKQSFYQLRAFYTTTFEPPTTYNILDDHVFRNSYSGVVRETDTELFVDASVPTQFVSRAVRNMSFYDTVTAHARQPYVRTICSSIFIDSSNNVTKTFFNFGESNRDLNTLIPTSEFIGNVTNSTANSTILWRESPTSASPHSILMAFASYLTETATDPESWVLTGCAVDAVWIDSILNLTGTACRVDSVDIDQVNLNDTIWQNASNWITIRPDWANRLGSLCMNISDPNLDFTSSGALVIALALSNAGPTPADTGIDYYYLTEPQQTDVHHYLEDKKFLTKYADPISVFTTNPWTDPNTLTPLIVQNYFNGYGYDSSEVTVQLALAVLGVYCLIALSYLVYTFASGHVGSSWDSVGELLMLGVNSSRADHLGHTSAGIETIKTFREPVNIRVNEQTNSLELVFVNNPAVRQGTTAYKSVVANERY